MIAPGRKIRFCIPKIKGICICLSLDISTNLSEPIVFALTGLIGSVFSVIGHLVVVDRSDKVFIYRIWLRRNYII